MAFFWRAEDEKEMVDIAAGIAHAITEKRLPVCLYGTLGAGKSTLCRAIIRLLCDDEALDVPSPTYTLVQDYSSADGLPIFHYDLYRLEEAEEIEELGFEESLADGLVLIEWPERLGVYHPEHYWDLKIDVTGVKEREITLIEMEQPRCV